MCGTRSTGQPPEVERQLCTRHVPSTVPFMFNLPTLQPTVHYFRPICLPVSADSTKIVQGNNRHDSLCPFYKSSSSYRHHCANQRHCWRSQSSCDRNDRDCRRFFDPNRDVLWWFSSDLSRFTATQHYSSRRWHLRTWGTQVIVSTFRFSSGPLTVRGHDSDSTRQLPGNRKKCQKVSPCSSDTIIVLW